MSESKPLTSGSVSSITSTPGRASSATVIRRSATEGPSSPSLNPTPVTSLPPSLPTIPMSAWFPTTSRSSSTYRSSPLSRESQFPAYANTPSRKFVHLSEPKPLESSPKQITKELHAKFNIQMKTLEQYLLKSNSGFPVTAPIQGIFKQKNTDPDGYQDLSERLALKDHVHWLLVKQANERWALVERIRGDLDKYCNGPAG